MTPTSTSFMFYFSTGQRLSGSSFDVLIEGDRMVFRETNLGKEVQKTERQLKPHELNVIQETITNLELMTLLSHDFVKHPVAPGSTIYRVGIVYNGEHTTIQCGAGSQALEPCQNKIESLQEVLNSLLGIRIN